MQRQGDIRAFARPVVAAAARRSDTAEEEASPEESGFDSSEEEVRPARTAGAVAAGAVAAAAAVALGATNAASDDDDEESGGSGADCKDKVAVPRRLCRSAWFDSTNKKYRPWLYLKQRDGCLGCKACLWAGLVRSRQDELSKGSAKTTRGNYLSSHEKSELHKTNVINFIAVVCHGDESHLIVTEFFALVAVDRSDSRDGLSHDSQAVLAAWERALDDRLGGKGRWKTMLSSGGLDGASLNMGSINGVAALIRREGLSWFLAKHCGRACDQQRIRILVIFRSSQLHFKFWLFIKP